MGPPIRNIIIVQINIQPGVPLTVMGRQREINRAWAGKERLARLTHDGCETAKLHHVAEDEEEGVEEFFFFGCGAASCEDDDEEGYDAEKGKEEVEDVERGFPELLRRS